MLKTTNCSWRVLLIGFKELLIKERKNLVISVTRLIRLLRVHEAGLGRRVDLTAALFAALAAPAHRQLAPLLCRCPRRLVHFGCVRRGRDEPPRMPNPSRGRRSVDCCACRLALILGVSTSPASMPAERPARVRRRMPLLRRCSARTASVHEPCWHLLHTLHIQSQPSFPRSLRRCLQGVPLHACATCELAM